MELNEEQRKIVEKELKEKVIINAPPGTGKTETIIQKLIYICNHNLADLNNILVLCFSRAAVKEIKDRVQKEVGFNYHINIRTIDSFCSWIIREVEEKYQEKLNEMNYEERIEYVIQLLENDHLKEKIKRLQHIIIDEFQDIVGARAEFIFKLLVIYQKGFSIFGDEYQAIFNYQAENMTSDKLIEKIKESFPECETIEYKEQHRVENKTQKARINIFRTFMKKYKNAPEALNRFMKEIIIPDIKQKSLTNNSQKKIAILARQNGEVYEIVKMIGENISYEIQTYRNEVTLPAWIAYILSDYEKAILTKEKMAVLIKERLKVEDSEKYWNYCKQIENLYKISNEDEMEIELQKLKENMIMNKDECPTDIEEKENHIVISTIHKAKGREYDEVYLHIKENDFVQEANPENTLDNARTLYVALTRAREKYYKYEYEIRGILFGAFSDKKRDRYYGFRSRGNYKLIKKIEIRIRRRY